MASSRRLALSASGLFLLASALFASATAAPAAIASPARATAPILNELGAGYRAGVPRHPVAPPPDTRTATAAGTLAHAPPPPPPPVTPVTDGGGGSPAAGGTPQAIALAIFGQGYGCISNIITRESGWNVHAVNTTSGAYGLGQALPGSKMAPYGPDWQDSALTQLTWLRAYVNGNYGG